MGCAVWHARVFADRSIGDWLLGTGALRVPLVPLCVCGACDAYRGGVRMKKWWIWVCLFVFAVGGNQTAAAVDLERNDEYLLIENFGDVPQAYIPLLRSGVLQQRNIRIEDQYYNVSSEGDVAIVSIVDEYGVLQDQVRHETGLDGPVNVTVMTQTLDGFAFVAQAVDSFQEDALRDSPPMIIHCALDGTETWRYPFEDIYGLCMFNIVCLDTGEIVVAGNDYHTDIDGKTKPETIFMAKISREGELLAQRHLGGSNYDRLYKMIHVPNEGIYAIALTSSRDGTFSASPGGYGQSMVFHVDNDFNVVWQNVYESQWLFDLHDLGDVLIADDGSVAIIGYDGNTLFTQSGWNPDVPFPNSFCNVGDRFFTLYDGDIYEMDSWDKGHFLGTLPQGYFERMHELDDITLIVTRNTKSGPLPEDRDLVYSAFDAAGNFLWRYVAPYTRVQ